MSRQKGMLVRRYFITLFREKPATVGLFIGERYLKLVLKTIYGPFCFPCSILSVFIFFVVVLSLHSLCVVGMEVLGTLYESCMATRLASSESFVYISSQQSGPFLLTEFATPKENHILLNVL